MPKKTMPPRIPDTPENIARAILNTPPKKAQDWEYLREHKTKGKAASSKGKKPKKNA